jgi:hypothetical protein
MRLIAACAVCAMGGAGAAIALASGQGSGAGQSGDSPKVLFAVLTGNKEVDVDGRRGAGDPNGRGTFSALFAGDQLCYGITVRGIDDPIAAHIHRGGPRTAGPIEIPLAHPTSGDPGTSSDCTSVTDAQRRALLRNPRRFYVNVHTEPFPGGAVRGQTFGKRR